MTWGWSSHLGTIPWIPTVPRSEFGSFGNRRVIMRVAVSRGLVIQQAKLRGKEAGFDPRPAGFIQQLQVIHFTAVAGKKKKVVQLNAPRLASALLSNGNSNSGRKSRTTSSSPPSCFPCPLLSRHLLPWCSWCACCRRPELPG